MMDARTLSRLLDPLVRRVRNSAARAVLRLVDDAKKMQTLQIDLLADETADNIERFQNYGITSHPFAGAEAAVLFLGGDRSHGIAVAVDDRRYRIEVAEGEVAIYDDQGQKVHLMRDRIDVISPTEIRATAPLVTVIASTKIRAETPLFECTGEIKDLCDSSGSTMSAMRSTYNGHTHTGDSGGTTSEPGSLM